MRHDANERTSKAFSSPQSNPSAPPSAGLFLYCTHVTYTQYAPNMRANLVLSKNSVRMWPRIVAVQ